MNEKLSHVYEQRDEYKAILELLEKKSKTVPGLDDAIHSIEIMLSHCDWFEHWRIDSDHYGHGRFKYSEVHTWLVHEINNQPAPNPTIFPEEEMLVIWHDTGPRIFGDYFGDYRNDYLRDFFYKFYNEVKAACPPDYEDKLNKRIYYKRERAPEAYKSYCEIRAKYHELNVERKKNLCAEMLEKELAKAKEEN